jgi:uncharacterized protein YbbK (DUF523 family)
MTRPRIGISRCLLGDEVRYDGTHRRDQSLIDALGPDVEWVPVCPEVEIGMGTPREPIRLIARPDGVASLSERVRLVGVDSGRDWTEQMHAWAHARVQALKALRLSGYILKAGSPSCGLDRVRVVHASVPPEGGHCVDQRDRSVRLQPDQLETRSGRGLFAQVLVEAMPDLPVEDEEHLKDPAARETFVERVLARSRR